MQFIKTEDIKKGMRLARPIYSKKGVLLYDRNSKISAQAIDSIKNFGLLGIYILEPAEPLPPMSEEDLEFERFQTMAVFSIKEILDLISKQKEAKGIYQFANQIIKRYGNLNHRINFIQNLRSTEDYVYKHSVNTAILAALMSHRVKMEFKQQLDVVVSAILHDVGSLLIPVHIRRKRKAEITEEDEKKIRTYHYAAGQLIDGDYDMDADVKRIVKGLIMELYTGEMEGEDKPKVNSLGLEILKVAYAFDTMTAMNFNEEPTSEITAMRYLLNEENGFDQRVVNALIESINILHPGVCVELTNGDKGLVVKGNDDDVLTPMILSFKDNTLYNMADPSVSKVIQIKDIMKTMDNRHVVDKEMLQKYSGETVHIGQRLEKRYY